MSADKVMEAERILAQTLVELEYERNLLSSLKAVSYLVAATSPQRAEIY